MMFCFQDRPCFRHVFSHHDFYQASFHQVFDLQASDLAQRHHFFLLWLFFHLPNLDLLLNLALLYPHVFFQLLRFKELLFSNHLWILISNQLWILLTFFFQFIPFQLFQHTFFLPLIFYFRLLQSFWHLLQLKIFLLAIFSLSFFSSSSFIFIYY